VESAPLPSSAPDVGNGRAVDCSSPRTAVGVNPGCTERINAAVPATSGDEKLVPTDALKASV
jgi:hypothetical protein